MQESVIATVGVVFALATASGCNRTAASLEQQRAPASGSLVPVGGSASEETPAEQTGNGIAAIKQAARDNKYLFVFFWKEDNEQALAMRNAFEAAMKKLSDRAQWVTVNTTDPSEREIVDKYDLDRAPMPLVLALAPNGAVTGGFPTMPDEQELMEAFVTPCTAECMKLLQDRKLVFLCVQNATTGSNEEAMQGIRDFKADARFASATKTVDLDPADPAEADFLADLQVSAETKEAVTVFLVPPGSPIAMFEGATNKDELVATLQKASSACGPGGCGPGGCGPKQ